MVELILQEVARGSRVLACAASNIAVGASRRCAHWHLLACQRCACAQLSTCYTALGAWLQWWNAAAPSFYNNTSEIACQLALASNLAGARKYMQA